jgi:hypothetical protein
MIAWRTWAKLAVAGAFSRGSGARTPGRCTSAWGEQLGGVVWVGGLACAGGTITRVTNRMINGTIKRTARGRGPRGIVHLQIRVAWLASWSAVVSASAAVAAAPET